MTTQMSFMGIVLAALTAVTAGAGESAALPLVSPRKKLIECSWATPTPEFLLRNIRTMEQEAPYDGIRIKFEVTATTADGRVVECNPFTIFSCERWQPEWLAPAVAQLKQVEFRQFTDNFIKTTVCPGINDWFDDAAWGAVCHNFGLMAEIARETGMKGICFDPEQYGSMMFRYRPESGHSYEETLAMARRRGREWGDAIFRAYPDITILAFFWLSYNLGAAGQEDPAGNLLGNEGLLVPFINGVYDVMPPGVKMVDGHEFDGYKAMRPEDFYKLVYDLKTLAARLVDPVNLAKYRSQTQLAPAVYLDSFFTFGPGDFWYAKPEETDRVEAFRRTLELAWQVSDEYVWSWGEQCRWWDQEFAPAKEANARKRGLGIRWEERAPGLTEAIRQVREPMRAIRAVRAAGTGENLLRNGDFEQPVTVDEPTPAWGFWQMEGSCGSSTIVDAGMVNESAALRLAGVANGCVIQAVPVRSGKRYLVYGVARSSGSGVPTLLLRWRDANGSFTADYANTPVSPGVADAAGNRVFGKIVTVPEGACFLVPLFGAAIQQSADDHVDFDDLGVYALEE